MSNKTKSSVFNKLLKKAAESDLFVTMNEMGYGDLEVYKFQKRRLLKATFLIITSGIFSLLFVPWFLLVGIVLGVIVWLNEYRRVKTFYNHFKFEKNLAFSRFMRMIIPYLLQTGGTVYGAFNSMLTRLEDGHVRDCLKRLLVEMNQNPNSVKPFRNFAEDASGTDQAVLFLTTLFDYQQNSSDSSVIFELGQMANQQLFSGISEIVEYKLRKFTMFPTKLVMTSFLIVLGYAAAVITDVIRSIEL